MAKTALLFPGQGAQYVGMGKTLYDELPAARKLYDDAAHMLGYNLADICFNDPKDNLDATEYSQPALYVTSLAALEWLRANRPGRVDEAVDAAGLSLGEYTALAFAGAISFEDGLRLVKIRGEAMQAAADARPSGMLSVIGSSVPQVEQLCRDVRKDDEILEIANYLCPGNTVISGDRAACDRIAKMDSNDLKKYDARSVVPLAVAGAFHTEIMRPAVTQLEQALAEATINKPRIPVIFNVDAQPHDDPNEIRDLLAKQVCAPVQWEASMRRLLDDGVERFCEVGPERVLRGLLKRIHRKADTEGTLD